MQPCGNTAIKDAEVGPTSGPTWCLSHLCVGEVHHPVVAGGGAAACVAALLGRLVDEVGEQPAADLGSGRIVGSEIETPNMLANLVRRE